MNREHPNDAEKLLDFAADIAENRPEAWENSLGQLVDLWASTLIRRRNLSAHEAGRLARELAAATAHYYGGRSFYLPKDDRLKRALRDHQIFTEFDGGNVHLLAHRYRLTQTAIYNILSRQRQIRRQQRDQLEQEKKPT